MQPILGDTILDSKWLNPSFLFDRGYSFFHAIFIFILNNLTLIISVYHGVLFGFSMFFLIIISYSTIRMFEIRKKEHAHLHHEIEEYAHHQAEAEKKKNQGDAISKNDRWIKTLNYLFSQHHSDWKLAVIEADSMLEELMGQLGFKGDTLGDKLKGATQEKFHSLSKAWEVHTIRNRIAHEGASFPFSQHEAKRVIALYEIIFREFGFI